MYLQLFLTTDPLHYKKLQSTSVHVSSKWTLALLDLICFPFFTFHAANSLTSCQQRIQNHLQRLETCLTLQWTPCILLLQSELLLEFSDCIENCSWYNQVFLRRLEKEKQQTYMYIKKNPAWFGLEKLHTSNLTKVVFMQPTLLWRRNEHLFF